MDGKTKQIKNWQVFPGFELELVSRGLDLPVNIAFVPNSRKSSNASAPLFYVAELYGNVKVITNNLKVHTYAKNLLNYKPDYRFPGTGESGVSGICVEPKSGDLFLSMIYEDSGKVKTTESVAFNNGASSSCNKHTTCKIIGRGGSGISPVHLGPAGSPSKDSGVSVRAAARGTRLLATLISADQSPNLSLARPRALWTIGRDNR